MKLPDIEYGPVQESSGAIARVGAAQRQALDTVAAGLQALSAEMIKTQSQKASADVEAGMVKDEADLASRRYIPVDQVKAELGDAFEQLPPDIREHRELVDDGKGGKVEVVPTYLVAGALFDKRTKDRIVEASKSIPGQGWQAEFQDAALRDLTARKRALALQQAGAMVEDFKATQAATVQQYVRANAYDRALATIDQSSAFSPGEKAQMRERVLEHQQQDVSLQKAYSAAVDAASSSLLPSGEVDIAAAQKRYDARADLTAEERAKGQAILDGRIQQAAVAHRQQLGQVFNRAQVLMNQGVNPRAGGRQFEEIRSIINKEGNDAGDLWGRMLNYWDGLQAAKNGQPATPAQQDAMVDFLAGLRDNIPRYLAHPELFKKEWMGRLAPKDLERAATYVGQAGLAATRPDETLPALVIQQITAEGQRAGVFPRKPPAKWNPDQKARFGVIVDDLLQEQAKAKGQGKQLDDATVKVRLGYWLAQGEVAGGGALGSNKGATRLQATSDEDLAGKPFVQGIQDRDRDAFNSARLQIDEELRKSGIQPDDDWRRWMFLKAKGVPDAENPRPQAWRPLLGASSAPPWAMGAGLPPAAPAAGGPYALGSR